MKHFIDNRNVNKLDVILSYQNWNSVEEESEDDTKQASTIYFERYHILLLRRFWAWHKNSLQQHLLVVNMTCTSHNTILIYNADNNHWRQWRKMRWWRRTWYLRPYSLNREPFQEDTKARAQYQIDWIFNFVSRIVSIYVDILRANIHVNAYLKSTKCVQIQDA